MHRRGDVRGLEPPERRHERRGRGPRREEAAIASPRTPTGAAELLGLQRAIGNREVQRLLAGRQPIGGVPAMLIQRFAAGTYVNSPDRGYVRVLQLAQNDTLLTLEELSTKRRRIISKDSREYTDLIRSPAMRDYRTTDVRGTVYQVLSFGDPGSKLHALKEDLEEVPHLTWAMQKAKDDVSKAKDVIACLDRYKNEKALELAKANLTALNLDVATAGKVTDYLLGYIDRDKPIYELAENELKAASNDVVKAKTRVDFLIPYLDDATMLGIARRELNAANDDVGKAGARMSSMGGLTQWASQTAQTTAETAFESAKEQAEQAEATTVAEAFKASKLSATAMKNLKKIRHDPRYVKYQGEKEQAAKDKASAIEQAELQKPVEEATARTENLQFVAEMTADDVAAASIQSLLHATGDDKDTVRALRRMMLKQKDPAVDALALQVAKSDSPRALAGICERLLTNGVDEANALVAGRFVAESSNAPAKQWIETQAQTQTAKALQDDVAFLKKHAANQAAALAAIQKLGTSPDLYEIEALLSQGPNLIGWLLQFHGRPAWNKLVLHATLAKEKLSAMKSVFDYNALNQNFAEDVVTDWVATYKADKTLDALTNTRYEVSEKFVQFYLQYGGTSKSTEQFLFLIRLDALLATPPSIALRVYQNDVVYAGSKDPPSRTGFLDYTFGNGDRAIIHTHWNTTKRILSSMHIQDASGSNGVEINQWKWFKRVEEAVRDAHNLSAAHPPTGGTLSL